MTIPTVRLNDGTAFPELGFGTYQLRGEEGTAAIVSAIHAGYRLLDSAVNYENEREVGAAMRESGVDRDELIVTTKVPGRDHGYRETIASAHGSLERLGLERIDLLLIHWPNPRVGKYVDTFRAMVELREQGLVGSVGVSNFTEDMILELFDETGVVPSVNQVELHPFFPQDELRAHHADKGVLTESWSPLGRGSQLLDDLAVAAVADAHGVTPAQAVLRWHLQLGALPVPKSSDPGRQRANLDVFGFELDEAQMRTVSDRAHRRIGGDPEVHEEF